MLQLFSFPFFGHGDLLRFHRMAARKSGTEDVSRQPPR
jgi:hypothetical protein